MNKELEITKEKLNTLEQAWDNINATGKLRIRLIIFRSVISAPKLCCDFLNVL